MLREVQSSYSRGCNGLTRATLLRAQRTPFGWQLPGDVRRAFLWAAFSR